MKKALRSFSTRIPTVKSSNSRVLGENRKFNRVSQQIIGLLRRSSNWKNRRAMLAGSIIKVCVTEGMPIKTIKNNFLRRVCDAATIEAIDKMLAGLGKKTKSLKH